jgi:hypothetical protein
MSNIIRRGVMISINRMLHEIVIRIVLISFLLCLVSFAFAQQDPTQKPISKSGPVIKKLNKDLIQVGNITIDIKKKEMTIPGKMLPTTAGPAPEPNMPVSSKILEYLATARNGIKAYESALELDTDATTFNFAMIMLGLEKGHAVMPKVHFDPTPIKGDPVEIWVEWGNNKVRAEELLYNQKTKTVPQMGDWVYTGSVVLSDGRYLAEMDGTLIGFTHDPDAIIEKSIGGGIGDYGSITLNPKLELVANSAVKVTVRVLQEDAKK